MFELEIPTFGLLGGDSDDKTEQEQQEETPDEENKDLDDVDVSPPEKANYLVPEELNVFRDKILADGRYARTYAIDDWPPNMRKGIFTSLIMNANLNYDFSLHIDPYNQTEGVDKLEKLETKLQDKRTGEFERFTPNKEGIKNTEQTISAMKQYLTQGEKLLDVSFYITIFAESEDKLERFHDDLKNDLDRESNVNTNQCLYQQKQAMVSNSPIAKNGLADVNDSFSQLMLSEAASQMFPFIEDTFMESGGCLFGINENSMTPVMVDIFERANGYNMLTTGMIGSGKSFSSSQILMEMDASYSNFQQYIIDPMGGFLGVSNALDGDRIILNGTESINPMDIEKTPQHIVEQSQGQVDPWGMKKQELRWFFSQFFALRSNETLSNEELATLDQAITQTYNRFGITEDIETHHKESPTILDLIETLEMIAEDAEQYSNTDLDEEMNKRRRLALDLMVALDPFKEGGEYHNLAQSTDIKLTDNRVIYLDMQQIPENSDDLGIMMQLLFMKLFQQAKTTTDKVALTIDEAHKLMGDEDVTGGLEEMFRHSRHFNLSINLISQTPEEFYSTKTAKTIAKQCTIKRFHRVDSLDTDFAKDQLEMNPNEINYIENAEMGQGDKNYSQGLLRVSDEDRSIPLRIKATQDEQMIIDYDPKESVEDFDTPGEQQLKQALDIYNQTNSPRFVGDDDELTQEVRAEISRKERNKKRIIAEEDPGQLTEEEREEMNVGEDSDSVDDEESIDAPKSTIRQEEPDDSDEPTGKRALRRRIDGEEGIDNLGEKEVTLIANQYGIGEDIDPDDTKALREAIKVDFFGEDEEEPPEEPKAVGQTDDEEDREADDEKKETINPDDINLTGENTADD
jgi:hypothetical protein